MAQMSRALTQMDGLERLAQGHSPLHRLHPGVKLGATLAYLAAVLSVPLLQPGRLVGFALWPALLMPLSDTPWRPVWDRLKVALPFGGVMALSNLLFLRAPAARLGSLIVTDGLLSCLSILMKTGLSVTAVLLLIATTGFPALCSQLSAAHVPDLLCMQLAMTYRYLSVLLEEAGQMALAYRLRSNGEKGIRMKDMGSFLGQLLLRSFDRAERVYTAMTCRGFSGRYSEQKKPMTLRDWLLLAAACGAVWLLRRYDLTALGGLLMG